jgi:hypothetical protein
MFTSLDEEMKHDDAMGASPRERAMKWGMIALASILLFGGLYFAIRLLA